MAAVRCFEPIRPPKLHYDALSVEAAMAFRSDRRFPDLMCPTAEF